MGVGVGKDGCGSCSFMGLVFKIWIVAYRDGRGSAGRSVGFRRLRWQQGAHGFAPMLKEELFFLSEEDIRTAEDRSQRGGHLQGNE